MYIPTTTLTQGGGGASPQPISILGFSTVPDTTSEAFFEPLDVNFGTNDVARQFLLCLGSALAAAPTVKGGVFGSFRVPEGYAAGAAIAIEWSATLTSGDVVFDFDYRAIGGNDAESLDPASWQESVAVTDTAPSSARNKLSTSVALTAGNLAEGDIVEFFFGRDGTDGADTMAGRAYVAGVYFEYTV